MHHRPTEHQAFLLRMATSVEEEINAQIAKADEGRLVVAYVRKHSRPLLAYYLVKRISLRNKINFDTLKEIEDFHKKYSGRRRLLLVNCEDHANYTTSLSIDEPATIFFEVSESRSCPVEDEAKVKEAAVATQKKLRDAIAEAPIKEFWRKPRKNAMSIICNVFRYQKLEDTDTEINVIVP